jgi:hypothetical protein
MLYASLTRSSIAFEIEEEDEDDEDDDDEDTANNDDSIDDRRRDAGRRGEYPNEGATRHALLLA